MRVSIRDETMEPLCSLFGDLSNLTEHVGNILRTGIQVGNSSYDYLASSNSQIRNHSCWFVEEDGKGFDKKSDIIRQGIGDLNCKSQFSLFSVLVLQKDLRMVCFSQLSPMLRVMCQEWDKVFQPPTKLLKRMPLSCKTSRKETLCSQMELERYLFSLLRRCEGYSWLRVAVNWVKYYGF